MADETRALARFAADLAYEQIPLSARLRAADILVDQLGVEIGCSELPWAKQVRNTYRRTGGSPDATVVRYGDRLPVGAAAFINSTFGHSFEYDDSNPLVRGHLGAKLVPSLMAVAERDHVSGVNFLTAFIAAYEVRGRVGWAVSPDILEHGGPHPVTACGPFGVAAGVGKLLGLDTEAIRNAIGIAGGFSGGLMQFGQGGGSVKRIYAAIAASSGIQAAHLAQAGMTGPEGILEGARGLLRIYSSRYRPERLVADLGKLWTIELALFKPHCCCAAIHPAIDGLKNIITNNGLKADGIQSIEVGYPTGFHEHVANPSPHDLLGMQFSTQYTLALTVLKGRNTPREYTMEALGNSQVRAVASKVRIREEAALSKQFEGHLSARVTVRASSGQVYEELVIDAKGSPAVPLSSNEIDDKFRSQVVDATGAEKCEELLRTLRNMDALDDVAKLPPMLVIKPSMTNVKD